MDVGDNVRTIDGDLNHDIMTSSPFESCNFNMNQFDLMDAPFCCDTHSNTDRSQEMAPRQTEPMLFGFPNGVEYCPNGSLKNRSFHSYSPQSNDGDTNSSPDLNGNHRSGKELSENHLSSRQIANTHKVNIFVPFLKKRQILWHLSALLCIEFVCESCILCKEKVSSKHIFSFQKRLHLTRQKLSRQCFHPRNQLPNKNFFF